MFTDAEVARFQRDGFIEGPRVVSDADADDLCARMHDVLAGKSARQAELTRNLNENAGRLVVHQIVNIWEADDCFHNLIYNETVCALAAQLVGDPVLRVWHDQVQYKPPQVGGPTDWHQDHPYWPAIQPADLVSAWIALDDADYENGCMRMVPGSHRWGPHKNGTIGTDPATFAPLPDREALPPDAVIDIVPCPVKKGHVMFHHCLTWHGSPPNRSDRGRPAVAIHLMPGYTRYEPSGSHVMDKRIDVAPGAVLEGAYFPVVWHGGPVTR